MQVVFLCALVLKRVLCWMMIFSMECSLVFFFSYGCFQTARVIMVLWLPRRHVLSWLTASVNIFLSLLAHYCLSLVPIFGKFCPYISPLNSNSYNLLLAS